MGSKDGLLLPARYFDNPTSLVFPTETHVTRRRYRGYGQMERPYFSWEVSLPENDLVSEILVIRNEETGEPVFYYRALPFPYCWWTAYMRSLHPGLKSNRMVVNDTTLPDIYRWFARRNFNVGERDYVLQAWVQKPRPTSSDSKDMADDDASRPTQ